ncbi:hypothetical protein N752_29080 [Desulforamulus aquiferis]|nr:DUF3862 domain-containing protein [Desulforamulus aquiferis]RYD01633.1 hypothetical protein N752_29080 [Desulforamulus aquiferis]
MRKLMTMMLVSLVIVGMVGCGSERDNGGPKVSLEQFNSLENGMTYEQVQQILGGPGELGSETGKSGDFGYNVIYNYRGNTTGSIVMLQFTDKGLHSKTQAGLK